MAGSFSLPTNENPNLETALEAEQWLRLFL
jgi:hypothetical protein